MNETHGFGARERIFIYFGGGRESELRSIYIYVCYLRVDWNYLGYFDGAALASPIDRVRDHLVRAREDARVLVERHQTWQVFDFGLIFDRFRIVFIDHLFLQPFDSLDKCGVRVLLVGLDYTSMKASGLFVEAHVHRQELARWHLPQRVDVFLEVRLEHVGLFGSHESYEATESGESR